MSLAGLLIRGDFRFDHIRKILKSRAGDFLDGGVINGRSGKIRIDTLTEKSMGVYLLPLRKRSYTLSSSYDDYRLPPASHGQADGKGFNINGCGPINFY
jgi:hypothetical protein